MTLDGLAAQLKTMKVGDVLTLPGGQVKRTGRRDYCLSDDNNHVRTRWGTLAEITADAEFFVVNGRLPQPVGPRMW